MRIAVMGTRGIPARYGGFETFAEEISTRLADRGHQVTVYCRRAFAFPNDVFDSRLRRVILPSIHTKYLDTVSHTLLSVLHVIFSDVNAVLLCNVANSPWAWIPRLFGKRVVLNVDGLDRKRKKWNWLGRLYLLVCEALATLTPSELVTDAKVIQEYFWKTYRKRSTMIPYGAQAPAGVKGMDGFHLSPRQYMLYVSRLEPENNPDTVIRAFGKVDTDWRLVVVGGNPYNERYLRHLHSIADPRVVFTGPVYGTRYWQLLKNAGMYVSGSEVGGTHPGLIEAMVTENLVLYRNTPENCEAVADCGIPFSPGVEDLAAKMRSALEHPNWRAEKGARSRARVESIYGWDRIAARYEGLLQGRVTPQATPVTPQRATRPAWQSVGSGPARVPRSPTPAVQRRHVSEDGA